VRHGERAAMQTFQTVLLHNTPRPVQT
jgi:hypothetical protein